MHNGFRKDSGTFRSQLPKPVAFSKRRKKGPLQTQWTSCVMVGESVTYLCDASPRRKKAHKIGPSLEKSGRNFPTVSLFFFLDFQQFSPEHHARNPAPAQPRRSWRWRTKTSVLPKDKSSLSKTWQLLWSAKNTKNGGMDVIAITNRWMWLGFFFWDSWAIIAPLSFIAISHFHLSVLAAAYHRMPGAK